MGFTIENLLLIGSILLFISIIGSKSIGRLGVPTLLLFVAIGMVAGSDGLGGIYFDNPKAAQSIGTISLVFILFSGGMDTKWESIKPVIWRGISLATLGVFLTASLVGLFATFVLGFSLLEGLLLGSIVSSTDAAAVFSILRSKKMGLKRNLRPLLELESGSNDPMSYFLTISFTYLLINSKSTLIDLVPMFFQQMILGAIIGICMGKVMVFIINKIKLDYEGLYPVLILSLVLFTYYVTEFVHGNGFLSIYISALILGNSNFIHKKTLLRFYDGIAWLMQIIMFITLGLLVYPTHLIPVAGLGVLMAVFLVFVARPAGIFLSLSMADMSYRDKLFVSWVGLRGSVPIVFATYPLISGVVKSKIIFNLVFFIVLTSVLVQGTSMSIVAKWLRLTTPEKIKKNYPLEIELSDDLKNELFEVEIPADSFPVHKSIVQLNFPRTCLIVLIKREGKYITPNGSTEILAGDKLLIMADGKTESEKAIQLLTKHS